MYLKIGGKICKFSSQLGYGNIQFLIDHADLNLKMTVEIILALSSICLIML